MIPYEELLQVRCPDVVFEWDDRDAMLYALAIGLAADPLDPRELPFVYERALKVMPSFATVAAWGSNPSLTAAKVDYEKVVHAAQEIELHAPLPPAARVRAEGGMVRAVDKGDRGALIEGETRLRDVDSGVAYVTNRVAWLARADGHFGGPRDDRPQPHPMPDRAPDHRITYATAPGQALLYRLCGDRNPLHIDPEVAGRAGFSRPILHGLCTFGLTCRAVLDVFCDMDPARLASHAVRFSAPVLPGDMLSVDLWRNGDVISFEAQVPERGTTVIRNGRARLR